MHRERSIPHRGRKGWSPWASSLGLHLLLLATASTALVRQEREARDPVVVAIAEPPQLAAAVHEPPEREPEREVSGEPLESEPQLVEPELPSEREDPEPAPVRTPTTYALAAELDPARLAWRAIRPSAPPRAAREEAPSAASVPVQAAPPTPAREPLFVQATPQATPAPVYPAQALRRRLEGVVTMELAVDARGRVRSAQVVESSGHELLDSAAVNAALQWQFHPAALDGSPVDSLLRQRIVFQLVDEA
ncbi:MAG: TonB family protein [Planctomycetes bacterium]|nr:TonB family protein [Planctomycetota bacterium]